MRCMTCGEPMAVTAVVPHEDMAGFAYRVLHCSACGTTERRFVFGTEPSAIGNGSDTSAPSAPAPSPRVEPAISVEPPPPQRSTERKPVFRTEPSVFPIRSDASAPSAPAPSPRVEPAISVEPPPPQRFTERKPVFRTEPSVFPIRSDASAPSAPASSPRVEPPISREPAPPESPQPGPVRGSAWERAVEKLRSHQANLHARADEAKKADWTGHFNRAWEKLAPSPRQPVPAIGSTHRTDWSRKALRAEMRKLSGKTSHQRADDPALERNPEAAERFNQLWERLLSPEPNVVSAQQAASIETAVPAPLPRSLSLVPVEAFETLETLQAMNAAKRAILLLRGLFLRAVPRLHP